MENTFLMIKPDAVAHRNVGDILCLLERSGFEIVGAAARKLTTDEAGIFYDVHVGKPFFDGLIGFITSGLTLGLVLKGENALKRLRLLVGATDPGEAAPGTIRSLYGTDIRANAVHASDSQGRVSHEMALYFDDCGRALVT